MSKKLTEQELDLTLGVNPSLLYTEIHRAENLQGTNNPHSFPKFFV